MSLFPQDEIRNHRQMNPCFLAGCCDGDLSVILTIRVPGGKQFNVLASIDDPIWSLKPKIKKQISGLPLTPKLVLGQTVLDDSHTLKRCGIMNGSVLRLIDEERRQADKRLMRELLNMKHKIVVPPAVINILTRAGESFSLIVSPQEKVLSLKERIHFRFGFPAFKQRLVYLQPREFKSQKSQWERTVMLDSDALEKYLVGKSESVNLAVEIIEDGPERLPGLRGHGTL